MERAATDGSVAAHEVSDTRLAARRWYLLRGRGLLPLEERVAFRRGLAVTEHREVLLKRVLVLHLERAFVEMGVDLRIEVGPAVEHET